MDPAYFNHQVIEGRAFVMGRSDWEYVFNTFAFGYAVGYHFIETDTGTMNGNFLGIGMDLAYNASVQVRASVARIGGCVWRSIGRHSCWRLDSAAGSAQCASIEMFLSTVLRVA